VKKGKEVVFADRDAEIGLERLVQLRDLKTYLYTLINLPLMRDVPMSLPTISYDEMKSFALSDKIRADPIFFMSMMLERGSLPLSPPIRCTEHPPLFNLSLVFVPCRAVFY